MTDDLVQVAGHRDNDHGHWPIVAVLEALGWDGELARRRGRRGWTYIESCPFHAGDGGAAYSEELNSFRCYACDAKGNSVTLVMQQHSVSAAEAVTWLTENVSSAESHAAPTRSEPRMPWEHDFIDY